MITKNLNYISLVTACGFAVLYPNAWFVSFLWVSYVLDWLELLFLFREKYHSFHNQGDKAFKIICLLLIFSLAIFGGLYSYVFALGFYYLNYLLLMILVPKETAYEIT